MDGPLVTLTKHWAVVVEYLDEDGSVDVSELYEANNNGQGVVVANNTALKKRDITAWRTSPGRSLLPIMLSRTFRKRNSEKKSVGILEKFLQQTVPDRS
jgi:hypothetical protein